MNNNIVDLYREIRNYMISEIEDKIDLYLTKVCGNFSQSFIVKEIDNLFKQELNMLYTEISMDKIPHYNIILYKNNIEYQIQNYFNNNSELIYLGTKTIGDEILDCYCEPSCATKEEYTFVVKYGHEDEDYYIGSKVAKDEYNLGEYAPLSLAYELAIDNGFID